jgi:Tol biopolymer transport system component
MPGQTRIGATDTWNGFPSWSPDGASIAYVTLRPCASVEAGAPIMQPEIAIISTIRRVLVTDTHRFRAGLCW